MDAKDFYRPKREALKSVHILTELLSKVNRIYKYNNKYVI